MIGEYFRVFVSYAVITLALVMYESKKRKNKSLAGQQLAAEQGARKRRHRNESKAGDFFQILAVVLLVAIGYTMTIIGRGHTIYLDSKTLEYDGQTYKPAYKTVVYVDGQQVAKLYDKERGVATCIGQTLTVTLEITQQKGGTEEVYAYNIPVPRKMDNVIINLPGFLAGLPEEAYLSEFIPSPDEVAADETDVPSDDDFGMEDMGLGDESAAQ